LIDDTQASAECVPHYMNDYPHTKLQRVEPKGYGLTELGDCNDFRMQEVPFWYDLLGELGRL